MNKTEYDVQTIVAQCTPSGSGALALIRICGNDTVSLLNGMADLASGKKLIDQPTHTIHYGSIVSTNSTIDTVLFLLMRAPHTFTGQDTVEITCHNNPFIIQEIIAAVIAHGARLADPGEFSKRAVLNGKMDLVQAEAIDELIHANTYHALKRSLAQLQGSLSEWIEQIEQQLLHALALCNASFEFLDDESIEFSTTIAEIIINLQHEVAQITNSFNQQQHIRQGIRIALVGSVNAGKSSLFNTLIGKNRAIVTPIAGTTRDVIEAGLYKDGAYWTLIDTAGLRTTDDIIEQEGIARTFAQAHEADVLLLVFDASRTLQPSEQEIYNQLLRQYDQKIISVFNKCDAGLVEKPTNNAIICSTHTKEGIDALQQALHEKIAQLLAQHTSPFLINKRQQSYLQTLQSQLDEIAQLVNKKPTAYELIAIHLNEALAQLLQLTGKTVSESAMDQIFKHFCIGK